MRSILLALALAPLACAAPIGLNALSNESTLAAGCDVQATTGTTPPAGVGTPDELKHQLDEIFLALKKKQRYEVHKLVDGLRLPDEQTWFSQAFGDDLGRKLAQNYAASWPASQRDGLELGFKKAYDYKMTDISIREATNEDIIGAPQIPAYLKAPVVFYTAVASKHGKGEWKLEGVYVFSQGSFRCIPESVFTVFPGAKRVRVRLAGDVEQAKIIKSVPPIYPPAARSGHVTGTVVLHVIIGTDGLVSEVSPVSGPAILQQPAADAVRQWRYQVTTLNGVPVEVDTNVSVSFSLS